MKPRLIDIVALVAQAIRGGKHRVALGPQKTGGAVFDDAGEPVGLFKVEGETLHISLDVHGQVEYYKLGLERYLKQLSLAKGVRA
jgi:hypothetical protein